MGWFHVAAAPAALLATVLAVTGSSRDTQYCVVGAGPGGLQIGYFLKSSGRDYIIFEKNTTAGSFFRHYPRHRTLISINKRFTGSTNQEFNFRHDWNSLISDNPRLQMKYYSKLYLPHADDYVRYLQDYASELDINVRYNTEIREISKEDGRFALTDQTGEVHSCSILIVSTGLWVPNIPNVPGIELVSGYESMSIDPDDFEGKRVMILGRGNAGFETAAHIVGSTAYIHMASRSRIKQAYQTHYVGDLRAVNDALLDTYQLKSLDGQIEALLDGSNGIRIEKNSNGELEIHPSMELRLNNTVLPQEAKPDHLEDRLDLVYHEGLQYDSIIRCTGFKFDFSIFSSTANAGPMPVVNSSKKYPDIRPNFESETVPGLFFAGTATHGLDYKKSAGGFVHGFRYNARALHHHLEWRYHGNPWPSLTLSAVDLTYHLMKRINEASGLYQMFGVLGDVMLIRDNFTIVYLEEVPLAGLSEIKELTGHKEGPIIFLNFEYGKSFSGPGKDVLREGRATGDPTAADMSNFLHPVLYYIKDSGILTKTPLRVGSSFPSDQYHHVVEDFETDWTERHHVLPVQRFLESVLGTSLDGYTPEDCFELILAFGPEEIPLVCKHHYLQGLSVGIEEKVHKNLRKTMHFQSTV